MSRAVHVISSIAEIPHDHRTVRTILRIHDPLDLPNRGKLTERARAILDDFMAGTRQGDIHDFWSQHHFMTNCTMQIRNDKNYIRSPISDETYKRITPALRLATIMMERNMDLWLTIIYATEKFDYYRKTNQRWLDEANFTIKDYHRDDFNHVVLPKMSAMTLIGYDTSLGTHIFGTATALFAATPGHLPSLKFGIGCQQDVWDPFTKTAEIWKATPHDERCRAWVHLAITLIHEFAHVLQMYRDRAALREKANATKSAPNIGFEPRLCTHDEPELGHAFEITSFGGIMDMPYEDRAWRDCSRPTIFDYEDMEDIPQMSIASLPGLFTDRVDVSPETIVQFMQESTWANGRVLHIYAWLHQ